jgi:uncharacterized protein (TIGR02246 family)
MRTFRSLTLVLAVVTAACNQTTTTMPPDTAKDTAAINTLRSDYEASFNSGDLNKLMTLYTVDAVMMQEHQPAAAGADSIRKVYEGMMSQFTTHIALNAQETKVMGGMAFDRGTFTLALTPKTPGAQGMSENGKYLVLLQKGSDGSWKLAREIGNTSDPMMPSPPSAPAAAMNK